MNNYDYFQPNGQYAFSVNRKDNSDGTKKIFTYTKDHEGSPELKSIRSDFREDGSRALYKIHDHIFFHNPKELSRFGFCAVIVEGEKCAESVNDLFGYTIAVTSSHGASSPEKSDWSPLGLMSTYLQLPIICVPDNDECGARYIKAVSKLIFKCGPNSIIKICKWPECKSSKWDIADTIAELSDGGVSSGEIKAKLIREWKSE